MVKRTTEEFIESVKRIHGNKYIYHEINYLGAHNNVTVICKIHRRFNARPGHLLDGRGCNKCRLEDQRKKNKDKFLKEAKAVHGNLYKYNKVKYISARKNVVIVCKVHGDFKQLPMNHIKHGCYACGNDQRSQLMKNSLDDFLKKAKIVHGDFYDYKEVDYQTARKKIKIICPIHGEFLQQPGNHLGGQGCNVCGVIRTSSKQSSNTQDFINKSRVVHGNFYNYDKTEYKQAHTIVLIACPEHGDFSQKPTNHLGGKGCPDCIHKSEGRISIYLESKKIKYKREFHIENRRYDFYIPSHNLLIERDGEQHYLEHKFFALSLEEQKKIDKYKVKIAIKNSYKLSRIPFWLSEDEEELELENILKSKPTYSQIPNQAEFKIQLKPNERIVKKG